MPRRNKVKEPQKTRNGRWRLTSSKDPLVIRMIEDPALAALFLGPLAYFQVWLSMYAYYSHLGASEFMSGLDPPAMLVRAVPLFWVYLILILVGRFAVAFERNTPSLTKDLMDVDTGSLTPDELVAHQAKVELTVKELEKDLKVMKRKLRKSYFLVSVSMIVALLGTTLFSFGNGAAAANQLKGGNPFPPVPFRSLIYPSKTYKVVTRDASIALPACAAVIGTTDGNTLLFDYATKKAIRVPSDTVVLTSAKRSDCSP